MAVLKPFRGLRPPSEMVRQIAAPPYDVVSTVEARAYAQGNEASFFHISRPEIELPGVDDHDDEVYLRGVVNLRAFIARGWLQRDPHPCYSVYRQVMGSQTQVGLVAAASVDEYEKGLIKKHELTRADKEDDRTRHIEQLGANDEPVFLTYRADPQIDQLISQACGRPPTYDFTTEDQVAHTFWVVDSALAAPLARAFEKVPFLYIADGHHRSAAASRVHQLALKKKDPQPGHDSFLTVVFPHDQMQILDYNRVVRDLNGHTPEKFLQAVRERFEVEPFAQKKPTRKHTFGMYLDGNWYLLTARPAGIPASVVGSLDVSILQSLLLAPVLGIGDPRKDPRIDFVGGIRGMDELQRRVDSGSAQVAFSMFPPSLDQLMAIADAGEIMPPKSTWFEPKLRSGLVVHPFERE